MTTPCRIGLLLLVTATASFAQTSFTSLSIPSRSASANSQPGIDSERHLQVTPLGALYANSAFAHGYRHGYDEGFHFGDLNLQIGRDSVRFPTPKECQHSRLEYRESFGSKQLFEQGYQAGFRGGYVDAVTGVEYRVRQRSDRAAAGLATEILPATRRVHFDEGFANGYMSAQTENAPSEGITADYVEQYCRKNASGPYALEYCSGFSRGYLLGIFNAPAATTQSAGSRSPKDAITNRR